MKDTCPECFGERTVYAGRKKGYIECPKCNGIGEIEDFNTDDDYDWFNYDIHDNLSLGEYVDEEDS